MWKCIRCAPLAAVLAAAPPALATGIEKPPSVPPEVEEARLACPTVVGPCYGYHPTRWRALPCCTPDPVPPAALPKATPIPVAAYGRRVNGVTAMQQHAIVDREPSPRTMPPTAVRPVKAWVASDDK